MDLFKSQVELLKHLLYQDLNILQKDLVILENIGLYDHEDLGKRWVYKIDLFLC